MIVAIHQPNYLPYLGFFDKMKRSDIFVIYDDAQFNKSDFQHRNKIRIFNGWKWLTVPVNKKQIPINQIEIENDRKTKNNYWFNAHFDALWDNYKKSPFFPSYEKELRDIYHIRHKSLCELNMKFIYFLKDAFNIQTEIVFSSEFKFASKSSCKIIDIVKALEGDTYLSGPKGKDYLDLSLFKKKNISIEYQDFKHPVYKQCYEGFIENMSAIDLLLNVGKMIQ